MILREHATLDAVAEPEADMGPDRSVSAQWFSRLGDAITGDPGTSPVAFREVPAAIVKRSPVALEIAFLALLVSLSSATINGLTSVSPSITAFVAGDTPSRLNPPSGCRFRTRCTLAVAIGGLRL